MAGGAIKDSRNLRVKRISKSITIAGLAHTNFTIDFPETIDNIQSVIMERSPNPAYIFGSVQSWDNTKAIVGLYNAYSGSLTDLLILVVNYYA